MISVESLAAKAIQAEFGEVDRIIVVGDVHGDFERFIEVLQSAEVIDKKHKWIAGKTHLVQLGDIPDRGPDTRKTIEFLMTLEKSARRKGGRVHILIGNHEAMNMYGDLRYVTEGEYKAFATKKSRNRLEALYKDEMNWISKNVPEDERPVMDEAFRELWFAQRPLGFYEHRSYWLPNGKYGEWVLSKNAVLKIGDTLFVHGGIGPRYANWAIDDLNDAVRDSLMDFDNTEDAIAFQEDGPLWQRGLALNPEEEDAEHLEKVLSNFKVKRIVLGHTPTPGVILPRFQGKVILADVGLSRYYGDNLACLEIENGKTYAIHRGQKIELPATGTQALLDYLERIAILEPRNTFIRKRIQKLKDPESAVEIEVID